MFIVAIFLIETLAISQTNIHWRHEIGLCYGRWGYLSYMA